MYSYTDRFIDRKIYTWQYKSKVKKEHPHLYKLYILNTLLKIT